MFDTKTILGLWPFLLAYIFLIICFLADLIFIPGWSSVMVRPSLTLIVLFYWAIYRPTLMPYGVIFLLGLMFDAVSGTYMGLHALIWMAVFWMIKSQRRFLMGQSFPLIWIAYALISILVSVLGGKWAFAHGSMQDLVSILITFLISCFFFPPVFLGLHFCHRHLPYGGKG